MKYIDSNGWFSIAMLVFRSVLSVGGGNYDQMVRGCVFGWLLFGWKKSNSGPLLSVSLEDGTPIVG